VARLKNIAGVDVHVGRADGPLVAAGDVTQVDGDVTEDLADAYILGEGDEARAWPKSTWQLLVEPTSSSTSKKAGE
jgi:2-phospho-L-lactate guanylyltransferase (CobY/MobA/RfbA family)